ncbi:MAG: desulfoferrodoxin [Clostridiales bacterium]|nr:desulfoferrodoxin [Clostridiales bacterium]
MSETKFFICRHCGNIIAMVHESGVPVVCCGEKMQELIPNTTDASQEKHVPVITADGKTVTVKIGSAAHPMTEEHSIQWICLTTKQGRQRKVLHPGDAPEAVFALTEGDEALAAYAYCNLHGLWKASV